MGVLLRDLRFGVRQLRQRPGFAAVAIGSLALGIGLNVTIFSIVNAVLLRGQPLDRPEQLVEIYSGLSADYPQLTTSYPDFHIAHVQPRHERLRPVSRGRVLRTRARTLARGSLESINMDGIRVQGRHSPDEQESCTGAFFWAPGTRQTCLAGGSKDPPLRATTRYRLTTMLYV